MDTGATTLVGEREKVTHCVAIGLLQRTSQGQELLREAAWASELSLAPKESLGNAYLRFRDWVAEVGQSFEPGRKRGPRAALALLAARALGSRQDDEARIAGSVNQHDRSRSTDKKNVDDGTDDEARHTREGAPKRRRSMPIEPEDVPGSLIVAKGEGASLDNLLRRGADGLRWNVRKARDLIEAVTPRSDAVDGASVMESEPSAEERGAVEICELADMIDKVAEFGDDIDREILAYFRNGETDADIGKRVGMSGRAVCKRRHGLVDRARRRLG